MEDVVEVNCLEHACRLCLTTAQTRTSIFGVPHVNVPFADKIRACVSIQVTSNDKVSTLVCTSCITSINQWHGYKETCLKSQEKLQLWLAKQNLANQHMVTVKEEPVDVEFQDETINMNHVVPNTNNMDIDIENNTMPSPSKTVQTPEQLPRLNDQRVEKEMPLLQIKSEPLDTEDEDEYNIDVESVNSGELLINPLAVAVTNTVTNDRVMEADSTQKFSTRRYVAKKRMRRGPHTHYRGLRLFRKKCLHCKVYLHSKYSYTQHMSRFHGITNNSSSSDKRKPTKNQPAINSRKSKVTQHVDNEEEIVDTQNLTNPDEEVYHNMITTDPLTAVQRNIIGQLKTFSCYSCKQTFVDQRHTLNHIRQHMPKLRPFTCISCMTEFSTRSMYTLHCSASFECAMKMALVIPKSGQEKSFTCNVCLLPMNNRKELLSHLLDHADKEDESPPQYVPKPPKLKPIPGASTLPPPTEQGPANGPYMDGDPNFNHKCDLCGMIYRYRPNMFKHRVLCATLPENIRTSYRCIHCSMTYLVYKKFYTHVFHEHKRHEITCYHCNECFASPDDYLTHHETHREKNPDAPETEAATDAAEGQTVDDLLNASTNPADVPEKPFSCALCGVDFATKVELSEHRTLHLKVKIYSCVICRSMFSNASALEKHMKDHGIEDGTEQNANNTAADFVGDQNSLNESSRSATSDPGGRFNHCYECGKNFSNYANLKRHERNLHVKQRRRWSCDECKRRFKSIEEYNEHIRLGHGNQYQQSNAEKIMPAPKVSATTGKPLMQCPKCPKMFTYQGNLIIHCQNVHKENHFERARASAMRKPTSASRPQVSRGHSCDLCGKTFSEEQSLKTHRGWHLRTNYRLKIDKNSSLDETTMTGPGYTMTLASAPKPAKARKSFPNNPSKRQLNVISSLQCQVCDDRFSDVAELRKHLWDIHCARNKPEKNFTVELQCELCTNKFPDQESLDNHMKWHEDHPILSSQSNSSGTSSTTSITAKKTFHCDTCGKYYSNHKMFLRHKKLHKVLPTTMMNLQSLQTKRPYCQACHKSFSTDASLRRHKASPCHQSAARAYVAPPVKRITTTALVHHPPAEPGRFPVKKEPGVDYSLAPQQIITKKRPVTCAICKTVFPNMSVLYQHRQLVHNNKAPVANREKQPVTQQTECVPLMSAEGLVCCNLCGKQFPGLSNLKLHFSHKHKAKTSAFPCHAAGCKLVFSSANSLKSHEATHASMIYNCSLCSRHVFTKAAITKHMLTIHKPIYQANPVKNSLWVETDLNTYSVKNSQGTSCPKCKIKYPNLRALKIHFLKNHDET